MRLKPIVSALACVFVVGGTAMLAAPDQTPQPGQMTQARVWIQNRGRGEAVPISLQEATLDTPLRVRIVNTRNPTTDEAVHARLVQQSCDYHAITVKKARDRLRR